MGKVSLRGLVEVASDIITGLYEETSFAYDEAEEGDWDVYDVAPSP